MLQGLGHTSGGGASGPSPSSELSFHPDAQYSDESSLMAGAAIVVQNRESAGDT